MKRLINIGNKFGLMIVKPKQSDSNSAFEGCDPLHKNDLIKLVSAFDDIVQEPQGLPPKRKVQHEIQLLQDAPLPNLGLYRLSIIENEEVKKQVHELVEKGFIHLNSLPCESPIVLVPKNDGMLCMCMDYRVLKKITIKNLYPLPCINDLLYQ